VIDYPIPGNDDAIRGIKLIATALSKAIQQGVADYSKIAAEENRKREANQAASGANNARPAAKRRATTGLRRPVRQKREPTANSDKPAPEAAPAAKPEVVPEA
jgi:hypothetical protein